MSSWRHHPHEDILDVLDELPKELEEIAFGQRFRLAPDQVFVIGGSFGGAAAILLSLDPRVQRVVANCPVVDWSILDNAEKAETSNANYADYIRQAFGNGYRLPDANWRKLRSGTFYSRWHREWCYVHCAFRAFSRQYAVTDAAGRTFLYPAVRFDK